MVLVDTSIWIEHFRKGNAQLKELLVTGHVACHPFIIGELACGNLRQRSEIILLLCTLPRVNTVSDDEILYFIEEKQLIGLGIGIVDVHLLASAIITNIPLWTTERRLKEVAKKLNILYKIS